MPRRPLVITEDPALLDDLLRLTAVAGLEPDVAASPVAAYWRTAPLILIGSDRVASAANLPRRPGVVLVTRSAELDDYVAGIRVGASDVVELPQDERRLMERLARAVAEPTGSPGAVWSVLAGSGGVGSSLLAAALAIVAGRFGDVLLVEADPYGGGLDLLVGAEQVNGLRWPDINLADPDVLSTSLWGAFPRANGVAVLPASRTRPPRDIPVHALSAVLETGRRFARLVVVDISRAVGPAAEVALAASSRTLLVASDQLRGAAAAAAVKSWAHPHCTGMELVVRRSGGTLDAPALAHALGLPLAGELPFDPSIVRDLERGELPGSRARTPLTRLSVDLLSGLRPLAEVDAEPPPAQPTDSDGWSVA
jgi:secretion/DNA translocation related CpaE-like protein